MGKHTGKSSETQSSEKLGYLSTKEATQYRQREWVYQLCNLGQITSPCASVHSVLQNGGNRIDFLK